jgi:transposase-like protein
MRKRTRRTFTPQFKAEVVLAVLTGAQTQADLCRQHGLKPELVTR